MIEMTQKAVEKAKEVLKSLGGGQALRISAVISEGNSNQYSFTPAVDFTDIDEVEDFDGLLVYVDRETRSVIGDGVIDCNDEGAFVVYTMRESRTLEKPN